MFGYCYKKNNVIFLLFTLVLFFSLALYYIAMTFFPSVTHKRGIFQYLGPLMLMVTIELQLPRCHFNNPSAHALPYIYLFG